MILTINSDHSLQIAIGKLRETFKRIPYLKITVREGKDRSYHQNALSHAWYEQLARELPDDDAAGWKCYCKLHHGVPILRDEDAEFRAAYDASIKGMTYEQKLQVMRILPVTSLMSTTQLSKYLESVKADFGRRNVELLFPLEPAA